MKTNTNLNHNIWNNNGTWWAHYTVHHDDHTKQRVRVSLGTGDVEIARALRDFIMQATPKISSRIPRMRGQAMPDTTPNVSESRAACLPWTKQSTPSAGGVADGPRRESVPLTPRPRGDQKPIMERKSSRTSFLSL